MAPFRGSRGNGRLPLWLPSSPVLLAAVVCHDRHHLRCHLWCHRSCPRCPWFPRRLRWHSFLWRLLWRCRVLWFQPYPTWSSVPQNDLWGYWTIVGPRHPSVVFLRQDPFHCSFVLDGGQSHYVGHQTHLQPVPVAEAIHWNFEGWFACIRPAPHIPCMLPGHQVPVRGALSA